MKERTNERTAPTSAATQTTSMMIKTTRLVLLRPVGRCGRIQLVVYSCKHQFNAYNFCVALNSISSGSSTPHPPTIEGSISIYVCLNWTLPSADDYGMLVSHSVSYTSLDTYMFGIVTFQLILKTKQYIIHELKLCGPRNPRKEMDKL